ncbi:uncharacterized protein B0T15DRAFT_218216 [Chaetomium strumarium]|uniref:Uncharacterized protein n=1 Tax=Chaetomium strumarium TaxID=1170767 RepID=A0AAJ0M2A2_9PEZI|nr:hypothetical protein B0T15DRAFT_218216 [Chaetomium strumarium]
MAETTTTKPNPSIPSELFHTVLTVVHHRPDTSSSTQDVHVLGTHTTLAAAKAFALSALQQQLGYRPDNFATYAARTDTQEEGGKEDAEEWPHGDSVMVYAKSPRHPPGKGQEFLVSVDTTPNTAALQLQAAGGNTILLPEDGHLHYVLRSRTDYNQGKDKDKDKDKDKSGGGCGDVFQETEIRGCYASRDAALAAARGVLLPVGEGGGGMSRNEYAQYDEREGDDDVETGDGGGWPFGEDVYVHAVALTGEHYTVEVKTPAQARRKYGKTERGEGLVDEADVFTPEWG